MSDIENEVQDPEQDKHAPPKHLRVSQATLEPDWFLQELAGYATKFGIETSVTLQVGGMHITGMIISAQQYFLAFGESFAGSFSDAKLGDSFLQIHNKHAENLAYDPKSGDERNPTYIHLKNVHFYSPGKDVPAYLGNPPLWRGRISAIDGFFLGSSAPALKKPE